jgi:hypothetical protein
MCKNDAEVVIAYFKAVLHHILGVTEENHELQLHAIHPSSQKLNTGLRE